MRAGVISADAPDQSATPPRVLLMGVAGSGKSLIGAGLAEALGASFVDADSLHDPSNIARMRDGLPLSDQDRAPWLTACAAVFDSWRLQQRSGVLACSALKRAYRRRITQDAADVVLVHLALSRELAERRLKSRVGHFMPASLIDSQFADLEVPAAAETAVALSADLPPGVLIAKIIEAVSARFGLPAETSRACVAAARPFIEGDRP